MYSRLLLGCLAASVLCAESALPTLKSAWRTQPDHPFHAALEDGAGFSFTYEGKKVGPASFVGWTASGNEFRHPSGLVVIREAVTYPEFEAIEYTLRFRNESKSVLPALSAINAVDLTFGGGLFNSASVWTAAGSTGDALFPPTEYAIKRRMFAPMIPVSGGVRLESKGGMSSSKDMPIFFIDNQNKSAGIFVSIGWSAQWEAFVGGNAAKQSVSIRADIPGLNIKLRPGEEIGGPRIVIGGYRGPVASGANRLRRLVRTRYTPLVDGHKPEALLLYDTWFHIQCAFDEKMLHRLVDTAAELGMEQFLLDAAWYEGAPPGVINCFALGLGNWDKVDRQKLPAGLADLAAYSRSKGLPFGLWFEPERVDKRSALAKEHPEWIIYIPGRDRGVLDFGKPEVQEYVIDLLDRYIRELDLRYVRWDHNDLPQMYWDPHETPDRQGMLQIRHTEGVYRVSDEILKRHPKTRIEGCAGGGRQIDLEFMRRRHAFWVSDMTFDPHVVRTQLEGINHFLPGNYLATAFTLPVPEEKRYDFPDIAFQSYFGGAFGLSGQIHEWPEALKSQAKKHVEVFRKIRRYLVEDYYPLTPQPEDLERWEGWQFDDPAAGEGFIQAFRIHAPEASRRFRLQALSPKADYRLTDPYSGKSFVARGAQLTMEGLNVELPEMSSKVLIYQKAR